MAKRLITDVNTAKALEVSFVPKGSNPLAKVVLKKSADTPPEQPETLNMLKSVALAKALACAVTADYLATLTKEEEVDAFLAKSADERKAEVEKAGFKFPSKDEDKKVEKAEVQKSAEVVALEKQVADMQAEIAKAREETQTASIQKRAETEFRGLSIGVEKTVSVLKAIAPLAKEDQEAIESVFKAHAELAATVAKAEGHASLAKDRGSATAQLTKKADDLAAAEGIDWHAAFAKVNADPANAALVEKADEEEAGVRAA